MRGQYGFATRGVLKLSRLKVDGLMLHTPRTNARSIGYGSRNRFNCVTTDGLQMGGLSQLTTLFQTARASRKAMPLTGPFWSPEKSYEFSE